VDEEELDVEATDVRVMLTPAPAVTAPDVVAPASLEWLWPEERCHIIGVVVHDGARRHERSLAPWPHWGRHAWSRDGERLLIGGAEEAHILARSDGSWTTFLHDPGADGIEVAWLDGAPVAAGAHQFAVGDTRATANLTSLVRAVAGGTLLVVADFDGLRVFAAAAAGAPRLLARSWRTVVAAFDDATGAPHVVTADGATWRLSVRPT
jgi:hypothetical protein